MKEIVGPLGRCRFCYSSMPKTTVGTTNEAELPRNIEDSLEEHEESQVTVGVDVESSRVGSGGIART